MPTYRIHLTTLAACLVSIGSVSAQGDVEISSSRAENFADTGAVQERLITVEESVGLVTPLRQTHRLDIARYKATPLDESLTGLPAPRTMSVASTDPVHTALQVRQQVSAEDSKTSVMTAARESSMQASAAAGRWVRLSEADFVMPAQASQLSSASPATMPVVAPVAAPEAVFVPALGHEATQGAIRPVALVEVPAALLSRNDANTPRRFVSNSPPPTSAELDASLPVVTLNSGVDVGAVAALDLVDQSASPASLAAAASAAPLVQLASASVISDVGASPLVSTLAVGGASEPTSVSNAPKSWVLSRDDRTIKTALERWTQLTEWQLAWEYPTDFQINFNAQFDGDFVDVVTKVVEGLSGPERPIRAEFYNGNRVLRIVSGRE